MAQNDQGSHPGMRQGRKRPRASLPRPPLTLVLLVAGALFVAAPVFILESSRESSHHPLLKIDPHPLAKTNESTIAYAISVTGCGSDPITDGAAVLKHSIHLTSVRVNAGKYDYKMYAIVHPDALECGAPLADLGYTILKRDTPVAVEEIQGEFLRSRIHQNGCCGEKELVKLEAYTLVQHPIVVHLDLDTLVLKPLDSLFDLMLKNENKEAVEIMWKDRPVPNRIDAFVTRDYNMVPASRKYKPVQGGFLVLRPNMDTYRELVAIVKEGDFRSSGGWGGVIGMFHGAMTFQGIIPYYYDYLHPGSVVELNRCVYNQMCDNPRDRKTVKNVVNGNCRDGRDECEDCRSRPLDEIVTTHYTLCAKPWVCQPHNQEVIQHILCRKLHHEWYRIRSDLEKSWGLSAYGQGTYDKEHFYGFCSVRGRQGYQPIKNPNGSL